MYTSWKTLPILSEDILSRLWPPASRRRGSVIRNSDAVSLEPLTGAERGELCVIPKGSGKPRVLLLDEAYAMARALDMDFPSLIWTVFQSFPQEEKEQKKRS